MKKSFMTRVLAVSLSAAMAFSLSSATSLTAPEAAAKKLPANNKAVSISLKVGKSKVLKLKNYKAWNIKSAKSNKKAVASVANKGTKAKRTVKVTAKKAGTAKVTLTLGKRKTANSKATKYSKTIKKVVTVKVTKAATEDTTPTDTTPTDTNPTDTTPTTPTDSAVNVTPGALNIAEVAATKVDTLVVSFSSVVASTGAVNVTVTRGTTPVETKSITWNTEANAVTIETAGKMTKGTYTVTATDGKETTTGTVEITSQEVKEIKFLNETALTNPSNKGLAYVYYDVLDQYGQSMRDTVSIQWSSSATVTQTDRAKGRLTIRKNSSGSTQETFNYGDKIYVTGVYTKTGVTNSGTFSVGTEQSVDTIKYVGFLKKGTTDIADTLPANFKENQYQLLYLAYDQNGNEIDSADYIKANSLTFISDNVLVIKEVVNNNNKNVTVKGVEYCAANVVPGINVNAGGTVNLSAISTKTGVKSTLNFVVGTYRLLKSFEIGVPADIVADGETVEIPFTALDADGNKMTNFEELAMQSDFSKLTFNQSAGRLVLKAKDDGSARLVWSDTDATESDWNTNSANDIDRPVSLTAIVVGGETSNQMIYVQDKARPVEIASVDMADVVVNHSEQKLSLSNFTFLDQYGRNMTTTYKTARANDLEPVHYSPQNNNTRAYDDGGTNSGYVYDNGFFNYTGNKAGLSGTDFNGYTFSVGIKMNPTEYDAFYGSQLTTNATTARTYTYNPATKYMEAVLSNTGDAAGYNVKFATGAAIEPTVKFVIQKQKYGTNGYEAVSKEVSESFKVVTVKQLSNFTLNGFDKFRIDSTQSDYDTGETLGQTNLTGNVPANPNGTDAQYNGITGSFKIFNDQDATVKAAYNGTSIEIPEIYLKVNSNGDGILQPAAVQGNKKINHIDAYDLNWNQLYDVTSAKYLRKDASDTVEVDVFGQADNGEPDYTDSTRLTTVKGTALISDAQAEVSTFTASDTVVLSPTVTEIDLNDLLPTSGKYGIAVSTGAWNFDFADAAADDLVVIKDQYGKTLYEMNAWTREVKEGYTGVANDLGDYMTFEYLVKDVVENPNGYVSNNFTVNNNATDKAWIEGAECGDTFTLEITAKCSANYPIAGSVTKAIKVTVGADNASTIYQSDNNYVKFVRDALQTDLNNLLKTN